MPLKNFKFKLLLPGTESFSTSYQWRHIRQMLLINAFSPPLAIPLFDMQAYSKVDNFLMYWYRNTAFSSVFNRNIKK